MNDKKKNNQFLALSFKIKVKTNVKKEVLLYQMRILGYFIIFGKKTPILHFVILSQTQNL